MRSISLSVSLLAATVLLATPVRTASSQVAAAPQNTRTLAEYRFASTRGADLPARVTVADSAGVLMASFHLPGDRDARPMLIVALEQGLVLQGQTPNGVLTIELFGQSDPAKGWFDGRWKLGAQEGRLRGRVTR